MSSSAVSAPARAISLPVGEDTLTTLLDAHAALKAAFVHLALMAGFVVYAPQNWEAN